MRVEKTVVVYMVVESDPLFFENGTVEKDIKNACEQKLKAHIGMITTIKSADAVIDWGS